MCFVVQSMKYKVKYVLEFFNKVKWYGRKDASVVFEKRNIFSTSQQNNGING